MDNWWGSRRLAGVWPAELCMQKWVSRRYVVPLASHIVWPNAPEACLLHPFSHTALPYHLLLGIWSGENFLSTCPHNSRYREKTLPPSMYWVFTKHLPVRYHNCMLGLGTRKGWWQAFSRMIVHRCHAQHHLLQPHGYARSTAVLCP